MGRNFHILIIDDNQMIIDAVVDLYTESNYVFFQANDGAEAVKILTSETVDLVILDMRLPDTDGHSMLKSIKMIDESITVIIMTGYATIEDAVKATQSGAIDFIEKNRLGNLLPAKIKQVFELWQQKEINENLRKELEKKHQTSKLIGNSSVMQKLREDIIRVAETDSAILIHGETGTGKELIANEIHINSNRKKGPFIPVDCAAITDTTFESEFFGHIKGSYTGAEKSTAGLFRAADTGTIFFDEIGELSLTMQAKLLRTLQEREVRPVGGTKPIKTDFRLIAATNRNLEQMVVDSRFREDLYYRLHAIGIISPPLREREEDSALLFRYFLRKFTIDDSPPEIDNDVLIAIEKYNWPGNVRELQNALRHVAAFCQNGRVRLNDLPQKILRRIDSSGDQEKPVMSSNDTMQQHEKQIISEALSLMNGNRRKAAAYLGIGEATIYRKLKKYDL